MTLLPTAPWRRYLVAAGAACVVLWALSTLSHYRRHRVIPVSPHAIPSYPALGAGNATLGFSAIFALSPFPSWRTTALHAAANFTGLDIQIPAQSYISPEQVDHFAAMGPDDRRHPNYGSALAWLAHLDLIKHVVQSGLESVLILEDDVDWDLSVHEQMMGIAGAVRELTGAPRSNHRQLFPYGQSWDVLWVGLCAESWTPDRPTVFVGDATACPSEKYVGNGKGAVDIIPQGDRAVFRSVMPVCSFAYALTRDGARKVLEDLSRGDDEAFDIAMMNGCRERGLHCVSVLPEVFREYIPAPSIKTGSLIAAGGQDSGMEIEVDMGSTANIVESARCHALWGKPCQPGD
ncbi:hypothetical protein BDW62DRAFT_46139 [Aspergillus aurantiobrunneus]